MQNCRQKDNARYVSETVLTRGLLCSEFSMDVVLSTI